MLNINRIEFDNLTTTERNALVLPAKGTLIYNVTSNQFEANTGTAAAPLWLALSGVFDPDAIHDNIANEIAPITEKPSPTDGDWLLIEDSADGFNKKKINFSKVDNNGFTCIDKTITPPIITSNQNNYAPAGIEAANLLRLEASAIRQITGIIAPLTPCNQLLYITNIGTKSILLRNNNGASSAANRLLMGGNKTIQPDEGVIFIYDSISQRWRMVGANN